MGHRRRCIAFTALVTIATDHNNEETSKRDGDKIIVLTYRKQKMAKRAKYLDELVVGEEALGDPRRARQFLAEAPCRMWPPFLTALPRRYINQEISE